PEGARFRFRLDKRVGDPLPGGLDGNVAKLTVFAPAEPRVPGIDRGCVEKRRRLITIQRCDTDDGCGASITLPLARHLSRIKSCAVPLLQAVTHCCRADALPGAACRRVASTPISASTTERQQ